MERSGNEVASVLANNYRVGSMPNEIKISDSVLKEFQLGMKLESIFMPHVRQQRDAAYNKQPESVNAQFGRVQLRCAHYTSAEAALRIINSKCLWMRNTTCMSDYREV
jgi:hypothetical protein